MKKYHYLYYTRDKELEEILAEALSRDSRLVFVKTYRPNIFKFLAGKLGFRIKLVKLRRHEAEKDIHNPAAL